MDPEIAELFPNEVEFHQYMESRFELYRVLQANGYDLNRYYRISNGAKKDFALNIFNDIETTEALAVLHTFKDIP